MSALVPLPKRLPCNVEIMAVDRDGEIGLVCSCGWEHTFPGDSPRYSVNPAEAMLAALEHLGPRKIGVRLNANVRMSRGKATAQAIHAVLTLLGIHPHSPVIVLGGNPADITAMPAVIRDAGRTELTPGTLTAGATWLAPDERMERDAAT